MDTEESLIATCKILVEQKLGWGGSHIWTNEDFESLSKAIFEKTNVKLSPSTLKRIWGKVKYDSAPTPTTLNTLAQFIGYDHWRAFRQEQINETPKPEEIRIDKTSKSIFTNKNTVWAITGLVLTAFGVYTYFSPKKVYEKTVNPASFKFSARKIVPNTIPNSVVFEYDASQSSFDSVFIQQTWDERLTKQISKDNYQHTSIYYYPGFFQAKLKVGQQIVKETEVFIKTDGWLPLIVQDEVPIYLKEEEVLKNGQMAVDLAKIKAKNIALEPNAPFINFLNYKDFGLNSSDFELETKLKNEYKEGSSICQKTGISIVCKNSMIYIPLSAKGCISDNNIFFLEQKIIGKEHDLSSFGVDFNDFVNVRIKVKQSKADIFINEKLAYHFENIKIDSPIVGIVYRFQGAGSVDFVRLKDKDRLVYEDKF